MSAIPSSVTCFTHLVCSKHHFSGVSILFYGMFVVPPLEGNDNIIFACVRNLAGDHSGMAIGTDFQLDRM